MVLCLAAGCGGAQASNTPSSAAPPASTPSINKPSSPGVSLHLRRADGEPLFLEKMRGKPSLVFIFTTFDASSQFGLNALIEFAKSHPTLQIIAIAVQPNPGRILPAFADALHASFPLTYDPSDSVLTGKSDLGALDAVPCYILLNEKGRMVERHYGVLETDALRDFVY
jgi:cytochrome oxidase Cu insertion factor (SCO1/SenC/PrrC family)